MKTLPVMHVTKQRVGAARIGHDVRPLTKPKKLGKRWRGSQTQNCCMQMCMQLLYAKKSKGDANEAVFLISLGETYLANLNHVHKNA